MCRDAEALQKAAMCKTLALDTVPYDRHQVRAQKMKSFERAVETLGKVGRDLRGQRSWVAAAGGDLERALDEVLSAVPVAKAFVSAAVSQLLLIAEWAASHGLGRLTEVKYEEAAELEARMREALAVARSNVRPLAEAVGPARRLAEAVRKQPGIRRRGAILELLDGLVDIGDGIEADMNQTYAYAPLEERHRAAWHGRWSADSAAVRIVRGSCWRLWRPT